MQKIVLIILIFLANVSVASNYGFKPIENEYKENPNDNQNINVNHMPPIKDQDTIGICYGFAAATLLEQSICKDANKDTPSKPCELSPNERPAVLDLCRFAVDTSKVSQRDKSDLSFYQQAIHEQHTFGINVLDNIFQTGKVSKESCAQFDQVVASAKNAGAQTDGESKMWASFREAHNRIKNLKCEECKIKDIATTAAKFEADYKLPTSNAEKLKALAAQSYDEFLYRMLVPEKCHRGANQLDIYASDKELQSWPKADMSPDYDAALKTIKGALSKDQPVMVNRFCTTDPMTPDCAMTTTKGEGAGGHAFVISGYRRMCNSKGDCKDSLRVHNSWGQTWQNANRDGWVDAKELIRRTQYQMSSFVWIDKKKVTK